MHYENKGYANDSKGDFEHGRRKLSYQRSTYWINILNFNEKFQYFQSVFHLNKFFEYILQYVQLRIVCSNEWWQKHILKVIDL